MSVAIETKKLLDLGLGAPLVQLVRLARRRSPPAGAPLKRVLLVKLWGIGNLTMILPLARTIRASHPGARIDFLTLTDNQPFVAACPWIDRVVPFSPRGLLRPFLGLAGLALRLRRERYDLVLDFEQFLKTTALLTWLARPRLSVGFRTRGQWRHGLHDVAVDLDGTRHMARSFGGVAQAAGIPVAAAELYVPRSPAARDRVAGLVRSWGVRNRPLVALHVGSGDNFPGRRWPAASFARLADHLVRQGGAVVVFTGTTAERGLVSACRARMTAPSRDVTGLFSALELVEFLALVDLLVSNDTAPVHLAAALDVPLIAIYGPNTPALYGPLSAAARVFYQRLSCSPCITNSNAKTSFCRDHLCMRTIDPAFVAAAALDRVSRPAVALTPPTTRQERP